MLVFAVEHKKQIGDLTSDLGNDLRAYELTREEWKIAEDLRDTLKILKDATEFFCRGSPSLPSVIPAMDHIDATFTKYRLSTRTNPAIKSAISTAKKTLNRYYSRTDDAEVYRIAMILHPAYKLEYFRAANWEAEWIQTAEELVRSEFDRNYSAPLTSTTNALDSDDDMEESDSESTTEDTAVSFSAFFSFSVVFTYQYDH
ncbi:hypothetical protein BJ912DRAFT_865096 [Pholiota molesta]|nr:hypothetical protein BJ912DRAFT_865096 [Pholiota molesta]